MGAPVVAGQAVWEAPELRQNARNVKGHILDKSSRTDLIHAVGPPRIVFFLGITELAPVLPLLLPGGVQGFA